MFPNIGKWISITALTITSAAAGDLSSYRAFHLGMDLQAVEKQAEMKTSEAKMIHQRPAVIQDLEWRPRRFPGPRSRIGPCEGCPVQLLQRPVVPDHREL